MKGPTMANRIVCYSRIGENYQAGSAKNLAKGLSIIGNRAVQPQDMAAKWARKFA